MPNTDLLQGKAILWNSSGCPYAGGEPRAFERREVRAIGKLCYYGDAVTRYVVRLDAIEVQVTASRQTSENERWLRGIFKAISVKPVSREAGFMVFWMDLPARTE